LIAKSDNALVDHAILVIFSKDKRQIGFKLASICAFLSKKLVWRVLRAPRKEIQIRHFNAHPNIS